MSTMSQWMAFLIVAKMPVLKAFPVVFLANACISLSNAVLPYAHKNIMKEWVKEPDWKMAKRETFSSYLTFQRKKKKGTSTQE